MANLQTITDITISDRVSTQVKTEVILTELRDKIAQLEAELLTHKTNINVVTNPDIGKYEIHVNVKGVTKTVEFTDADVDTYLGSSSPLLEMLNDVADILSKPYVNMLKSELTPSLCAIIENRIDSNKGRKL